MPSASLASSSAGLDGADQRRRREDVGREARALLLAERRDLDGVVEALAVRASSATTAMAASTPRPPS